MTGLDTNILVRFFTRDDPEQLKKARAVLRTLTPQAPGFISLVCLVELVWVLRSRYRLDKPHLIRCIESLSDSAELVLESDQTVLLALKKYASPGADFADCLIERSGHTAGCRRTVTFDANAASRAGMKLL